MNEMTEQVEEKISFIKNDHETRYKELEEKYTQILSYKMSLEIDQNKAIE